MKRFPDILESENIDERNPGFRNALFDLDKSLINKDNYYHLTRIYEATKRMEIRNRILKLLYDFDYPELKVFFNNAYKRERYLDMKVYALRGLSNFITENEVTQLLTKFNQSLAKRAETTPYNYQEYELLRGKNALPFLIEKYGYRCFEETLAQVNRQYNSMPEAFKGHFTTDENGETVYLRRPEEVKKIMEDFWVDERRKFANHL